MPTIYAHFDVETTGPSLLEHSMIQLAIIFTDKDGEEINFLSFNIKELDGHTRDEATMNRFWNKDEDMRKKFNRIIKNSIDPIEAMTTLSSTLSNYNRISWVSRPASFDWPWLKSYYETYCMIKRSRDRL